MIAELGFVIGVPDNGVMEMTRDRSKGNKVLQTVRARKECMVALDAQSAAHPFVWTKTGFPPARWIPL